jgi:DUF971 family protein
MLASAQPEKLNLKKDRGLQIIWKDGHVSNYSLDYLRTRCPCAQCKTVREGQNPASPEWPAPANSGNPSTLSGPSIVASPSDPSSREKALPRRRSLTILPGNYADPLTVVSAELVGNYALQINWSDQHSSGIYSFQYLRSISQD